MAARTGKRRTPRPRRRTLTGAVAAALSLLAACAGGGADPVGTEPPVLTGAAPTQPTAGATPRVNFATPTATPGPPITTPIDVPILMYHHVAPSPPADEFEARLTVLTADFEAQLAYLRCAGYTSITVAQLVDAMRGVTALPPHPVILTFDDGYSDAYSEVFPLLRRYGFLGSFAIVTGFVGQGDGAYASWDQLQEMADAGMEMLSHSVSHIDLGTSDDETDRREMIESKAELEARIGRPVRFFVYPSGEPFRSGTPERQQQVVAMLQEAGYEGALVAGPNSLTQDPSVPFALNRVRVQGGESVEAFAGSIGGPPCP